MQTLLDTNVDITCITESWLSPGQGHNHTIATLKSFGFDVSLTCRKKRRGGGWLILVKNPIKFKMLKNCVNFDSFEWNSIRVFGTFTCCILCIYRKQEHSMIDFLKQFSELLDILLTDSTDELLVVGDFNVHFETQNKSSKDLSDLLSECGLSQTVTEPTRVSGHTLDLIFSNPYSLEICPVVNIDLAKTDNPHIKFDHYPIQFSILDILPSSSVQQQSKPILKYCRYLKQIDFQSFNRTLEENLRAFGECRATDFAKKLETYNQVLTHTLDSVAPLKPMMLRQTGEDPEWMDHDYKCERRLRR